MADSPEIVLSFRGLCPDCGTREVHLPHPLTDIGDDFDWNTRDYDGFRIFMLEELAARFPERKRWTTADLEVVIIEVMATMLDQLSDMTDRIAAETFLESARRPETVRQLLDFIGYDTISVAKSKNQINDTLTDDDAIKALENYWHSHPFAMEQARLAGPREIHTQKRMVAVADYAIRLRNHPLVLNAHAWSEWNGSWFVVKLAVIAWGNYELDDDTVKYPDYVRKSIIDFHKLIGIKSPNLEDDKSVPVIRTILKSYIEEYRMAGQEVIMQNPVYVGIYISFSVKVGSNHFQSEIRQVIAQVLSHGPGGFFEPGHFGFGQDLFASDVIEALMKIDGIENVCLNRFKRVGSQHADRAQAGFIPLDGLEVAICNNDPGKPQMGYYRVKLHGGRKG